MLTLQGPDPEDVLRLDTSDVEVTVATTAPGVPRDLIVFSPKPTPTSQVQPRQASSPSTTRRRDRTRRTTSWKTGEVSRRRVDRNVPGRDLQVTIRQEGSAPTTHTLRPDVRNRTPRGSNPARSLGDGTRRRERAADQNRLRRRGDRLTQVDDRRHRGGQSRGDGITPADPRGGREQDSHHERRRHRGRPSQHERREKQSRANPESSSQDQPLDLGFRVNTQLRPVHPRRSRGERVTSRRIEHTLPRRVTAYVPGGRDLAPWEVVNIPDEVVNRLAASYDSLTPVQRRNKRWRIPMADGTTMRVRPRQVKALLDLRRS